MGKSMMWEELPTPCYVIDERKLKENLKCLQNIEKECRCHILLAQKAFSVYRMYPLIGKYISGTAASGLFEARLGKEEMGKENHVYAPAYKAKDMKELAAICDHIIFNSFAQYEKYHRIAGSAGVSIGLRINPEYSTQEGHAIYDPCAPGSRLGITYERFQEAFPDGLPEDIRGFHIHTLCEQNADDLLTTFYAFEEKFGSYFFGLDWLNLGGGHHITRDDYQTDKLKKLICYIRDKYQVEVYLEPGEAVALNAGYLVTTVEDIVRSKTDILILDASAACHMPDVLEMPYRPPLRDAFPAGEKPYTYRLSSLTCLAGDIIGDYSFKQEIKCGDRLVFEDMAIYSMVKNNTFNGIPLPAIALLKEDLSCEIIREFHYSDFKGRLS